MIGLVSGGGYAEYCVVHADALIELPVKRKQKVNVLLIFFSSQEKFSFDAGAAVAEAFLTAYQVDFVSQKELVV